MSKDSDLTTFSFEKNWTLPYSYWSEGNGYRPFTVANLLLQHSSLYDVTENEEKTSEDRNKEKVMVKQEGEVDLGVCKFIKI